MKIAVVRASVVDNGDMTGTATYEITDASGRSAAWTVTLVRRPETGRWQLFDAEETAR